MQELKNSAHCAGVGLDASDVWRDQTGSIFSEYPCLPLYLSSLSTSTIAQIIKEKPFKLKSLQLSCQSSAERNLLHVFFPFSRINAFFFQCHAPFLKLYVSSIFNSIHHTKCCPYHPIFSTTHKILLNAVPLNAQLSMLYSIQCPPLEKTC